MQYRKLGQSTIEIAPIVFGGNVFGWTADEQQSFKLLDALVDHGINMVDTANVYSAWAEGHVGGESESIIGKWFAKSGQRDKIVLATKVGMTMGDGSQGLKKDNIVKSAEQSLKRLQTDYIDLYYAHKDDPNTPIEETLSAFETLIKDGKVRAIASSNYSAERLSEALDVAKAENLPSYIAHQPEYNLFDRSDYESTLEPVCQHNELAVVTYFSLASGFLSGKYHTKADLENAPRKDFLGKYMTPRGEKILAALANVANAHHVPMATVALAWIMHRPSVTAPIASATSLAQLEQLAQAATLNLSTEDMNILNDASDEPSA
ncbi:aldo/keto reductase [Celerinatantimonas diazotrophica]|uniref:Aryl-alcohol dehydrogenase-like predicted oxidoreductase n=1 Tax=Celerinatantimonas diazotrophica TaxID=412034 RepID=A0A4R1K1N0_9GAMM|nr:aldo/keto reductase [Celerinatantimonas diazotrophica]TCK57906.1 aryl-alcohol dehydrogenase-like predicted oxidoreductase [Celerinatantimonas diazotrophica]CAG9298026.1 1-deoxyxylulose-5-phosphate synthase YajO [Celerinatantimonas diazotrophica]